MREIDRVLIVQKSIKDFFWRIKSILKKVKNQCCVKISQFSNFQHWRSNSKGDFVLRNQFKCRYERFGMMNLINKNLRLEIFYKNDTNLKPYIIINCFHLAKTGSKGFINWNRHTQTRVLFKLISEIFKTKLTKVKSCLKI